MTDETILYDVEILIDEIEQKDASALASFLLHFTYVFHPYYIITGHRTTSVPVRFH